MTPAVPGPGSHPTAALWAAGRRSINCWLTHSTLSTVDAIARVGFDSVVFDMQHGCFEYRDVAAMQMRLADVDVTSLVRVPGHEPSLVMRLLDAGANGIICPNVDTAAQASAFVGACRYPPDGHRSFGPFASHLQVAALEYFETANESVLTIAQIESTKAIENLVEIVSTPGLDGVFVGPADLAVSGGGPPIIDYRDPHVAEQHRYIVEQAHAAGLKVGMVATTHRDVQLILELGADCISVAHDIRLIVDGASDALRYSRTAVETINASAAGDEAQPRITAT